MILKRKLKTIAFFVLATGNIVNVVKTEPTTRFIKIGWFLRKNESTKSWQEPCKSILSFLSQIKEQNPQKFEAVIEIRSYLNGDSKSAMSNQFWLNKNNVVDFNSMANFNLLFPELENPTTIASLGLEAAIECDSKKLKKIYNSMVAFDKGIFTIKTDKDPNLLVHINNKLPCTITVNKK